MVKHMRTKVSEEEEKVPWSIYLSVSWAVFPFPTIVGPDVSISRQCNLVLTPRHSSTKGWVMICLGIKGSGTMIMISFWHPSFFFLASKLVGQSLQSTAAPFGKLDKFSFFHHSWFLPRPWSWLWSWLRSGNLCCAVKWFWTILFVPGAARASK